MMNIQRRDLMRRKGKERVTNVSSEDWRISDDEVEVSGYQPAEVYVVSIQHVIANSP
jgi:hypothetical protein